MLSKFHKYKFKLKLIISIMNWLIKRFTSMVVNIKNQSWLKYDTESDVGQIGLSHNVQKVIGDISNFSMPKVGKTY